MVKKIIFLLILCFVITSCNSFTNKDDTSTSNNATSMQLVRDIKIGKEIPPIVEEKINTSKNGIKMPSMVFSTEMSKGDDGACYYIRTSGTGKEQVTTCYKNNGIKVCETQIYKVRKLWKEKYSIRSFVKYGKYIYFRLFSNEVGRTALLKVQTETGKSVLLGKNYNLFDLIFYENYIYDIQNSRIITKYDLQGNKVGSTIKLEKDLEDDAKEIKICSIVDGKIYYRLLDLQNLKVQIKRCDLKGDQKQILFTYRADGPRGTDDILMIDGDYMYVVGDFGNKILKQIPLYGGKIKGYVNVENASDFQFKFSAFGITENTIFYLNNKSIIYKIDMKKENKPELVTSIASLKILYADGHLMLEKCNQKEDKIIDVIIEMECPVSKNYAHAYDWITEKGEVVYSIKGSGLSKKDLEYYEERERWE